MILVHTSLNRFNLRHLCDICLYVGLSVVQSEINFGFKPNLKLRESHPMYSVIYV